MADQVRQPVLITGMGAFSALGRGLDALRANGFTGTPAFTPVTRFAADRYRTDAAATAPGAPILADELVAVIEDARTDADLAAIADCPLLLAAHADRSTVDTARDVARRVGAHDVARTYTSACIAATTAVADAATMIATGRAERVVVAAGYLVEPDMFALFDAGRVLARDGRVRPFSAGRQGIVLGDAVAAVVLESARAAAHRDATPHAVLAGWGRCGDAFHVVQPRPDGSGLARAAQSALRRAGIPATDIGYVNANGTGTTTSDTAETAALHTIFGADVAAIPVSSTKSVHGHALEASGLLELVITALALRARRLPVNAGFLRPDDDCRLDVVVERPRITDARFALSLNAAFGGANSALLVGAP
jgi:3-oxoacyl-[acyl-carrier-protein] synthase II